VHIPAKSLDKRDVRRLQAGGTKIKNKR